MSNPTVNFSFSFEVSYNLWEQLFVTAIEGGVNYWAGLRCSHATAHYPDEPFSVACAKYFWDAIQNEGESGGGLHVLPHDGDEMFRTVYHQNFLDGISKCLERDDLRGYIMSEDLGMIDAEVADAWFQYSCYGEIVYG